MPRNFKSKRIQAGIALAVCAMLLAGAFAVWRSSDSILTVDSGSVKADVIVVLGGGSKERPKRTAELFKAGEASRVICSGSGDCESNRQFLVGAGVPESAIELECESRSTKENAELTVKMLRADGVKSAIIVTTWYHSRRALACFEHYAPEINFHSRPSYFGHEPKEWRREGVRSYIRSEYVKLLWYGVCYGVSPF